MTDPLDATADALARHLLARHPADGPVGRAGLAALPGPVARRLAAHLDARADALAAVPASPWIDAEHESAREAARAWRSGLREAAQVPAADWAEALGRACREALGHLVDPAEALAAAAFPDGDGPRATADVLRAAGGFTPYPYLPQVAGQYAERKGLEALTRADAHDLFARIERRMSEEATPDEWRERLAPLFDLAGRTGSPPGTLRRGLLARALDARGHAGLADALGEADALGPDDLRARLEAAGSPESPAAEDDRTDTGDPAPADPPAPAEPPADGDALDPPAPRPGPDDTARVGGDALDWLSTAVLPLTAPPDPFGARADGALNDGNAPTDDAAPTSDHRSSTTHRAPAERPATSGIGSFDVPSSGMVPTDVAPTDVAPTDVAPTGHDEQRGDAMHCAASESPAPHDHAPDDDAPSPLWMRFATPDAVAPPEPADAPLWMRFALPEPAPSPPAGPPAARPAADSLSALEARVLGSGDDERRDWFTRELFSGDTDGYLATLSRLDGVHTWTEAAEIIAADIFRAHRVSLYTEAAVVFTDSVEARLAGRGGG